MTTSLVIESISPALASGADDPWVTASFTPPNNSVLVVAVAADWFGGTPTLTPVSTGLTFSSQQKSGALNQGVAQIWTADVGSNGGSARTVSVTTSLSGAQPGAVKVWCVSGQHASYVNAVAGGQGITTNDFDATITTTQDGCQVFGIGAEWNNLGAATSYDIYENATPGGVAPLAVRKASETVDAGVETINFNASTLTSAPVWSWAAIAIRPATYSKPAIYKRPLRARTSNLTSQTSTAVALTAASTIQVGSYLIASIALDNSLTSPAGSAPGVTATDPRSNTWSFLTAATNNPGTANSGTAAIIGYCKVVNAYSNGDSITFNYAGTGNSVPAKAIVIEEYAGIHATLPLNTSVQNSTGTSTTPSTNITPSAANCLVVGVLAYEGSDGDTYTSDTDTTNGPWNRQAAIGTTSGTAASNQTVRTISKLVTASGAQTWNSTITSRDWAQSMVAFAPAASSTPITGSESTAISVADSSGIVNVANPTDTAALAVDDQATIQKNFSSTDTGAISVADTSAHALSSSPTDSAALAVSDVSSVDVTVLITGSDTAALAVSDSSATVTAPAGTESTAISVDDQSSLNKTNIVTDTAAISVDDQSALFKTIVTTENIALAASDISNLTGTANITGSESTAISVAETVALLKTLTASDGAAISVDDQANKFTDNPGSDTAALAVDESVDIEISGTLLKSASDTVALAVLTNVSGSNTAPASDSIALAVSETVSTAVGAGPFEFIGLGVTEETALFKQISVTDTAALAVFPAVQELLKQSFVTASDTIALSVSDTGVKSDFAIIVKVWIDGVWVTGILKVYVGTEFITPVIHQRRSGAWS